MITKNNTQQGYTLLFAVLTAVLVLAIAIFILGVARKQYILSSSAQDSLGSLYNADSGVECIVQSNIGSIDFHDRDPVSISCNGRTINDTFGTVNITTEPDVPQGFNSSGFVQAPPPPAAGNPPTYIYVPFSDSSQGALSKGCAMIKIWQGTLLSDGSKRTIVYSRGYNQCDDATQKPLSNVRTVERAMKFTVQ